MNKAGWSSILVAPLVLVFGLAAEAQQQTKVQRVGMLVSGSVSTHGTRIEAFRQGLRELGYVEGKNIAIDYLYAEGKSNRFPELAAEMVRRNPDVMVMGSSTFARAAKKATSTIPIVATGGDLVGDGLVSSLAQPGGNVTGSTNMSPDVSGKRLELLKEAIPKASHVAVLWNPGSNNADEVKQTETAGRALGVTIYSVLVRAPEEFDDVFASLKRENTNAVIIIQGYLNNFHRKQLAALSAKNRLPSLGEAPDYANDGCLMSYGPNHNDLWRRMATFVDKIFKGARPADLPVEQPTKFELVINLKTAKQIGLTIPSPVLARADRVIK